MRLLPPRGVETHTNAKHLAESQRITAIRSQLSREERDLNDWNDSIEVKKQKAIQDFEGKVMVFNSEILGLQKEIAILESKRDILLKPLDDTPEIITERLAVTENLLEYLQNRKKELAEAKKTLELSQHATDKGLTDLLKRENKLGEREMDIDERLVNVKTQEEKLAESVGAFTAHSNRKNIELLLLEGRLTKKEVELAEREKLVAQGNEKIAQDRKRIESQQQSLIAALAEIKNKT